MGKRGWVVLVALLCAVACSSKKGGGEATAETAEAQPIPEPDTEPDPEPGTEPESGAMPEPVCEKDTDCALSCFENEDDCCGAPCDCTYSYPVKVAKAIEKARAANEDCKRAECAKVRCAKRADRPEARCVEGQCTFEWVPIR